MDNTNELMAKIPSLVRQKAWSLGRRGEQWLANLPVLIADLERVSTGLYILEVGAEALGREFLETAEMLV